MLNYKRILIEILIIFGYWILVRMFYKVFKNVHFRKITEVRLIIWTTILFIMTLWNLGTYYIFYPIIILSVLGIILIVRQLVKDRQFLYKRFWLSFGHWAFFILLISFICSIFLGNLPTA